jgi:UDPglucose 6-dehydrogenase
VGSATALLACPGIEVVIYDLDPARCKPVGTTVADLLDADLVFVCVPTPAFADGRCNTAIVERCIAGLVAAGVKNQNLVLRSTVPPGTSDRLGVLFMPEFLTEAKWQTDFVTCRDWFFGVRGTEDAAKFQELLDTAAANGVITSNRARFMTPTEAELVKYARNCFLATKIGFCNEMYRLCGAVGASYDSVQLGLATDPRIGGSHTGVPGYDGHFGFGGTCLPKDTAALSAFAASHGVPAPILDAVVYRNKNVDRPERDWEADPRAFTAAKQ